MRTTTALLLVLLLGGVTPAAPRATRAVGCCVKIGVPGLTPGPVCQLIHFRARQRRIAARRICRLIGGTPPGNGGCTCED